jgi:hypothetical protein
VEFIVSYKVEQSLSRYFQNVRHVLEINAVYTGIKFLVVIKLQKKVDMTSE